MECGVIACGLGFNGYDADGNPKFDRVQSCGLWNLEMSCTVKDFLGNWNISVSVWLKYYVYLRLLPNDKNKNTGNASTIAAFSTFLTSAVWHGFYPGFYLFFSGAALLDYQWKLCGKVLSPLVAGSLPATLEYFLSWLWCYTFCAYFAISFVLLSFENAYTVYSSMYFSGHIFMLSSIVLLHAFGGGQKKKETIVKKKVN